MSERTIQLCMDGARGSNGHHADEWDSPATPTASCRSDHGGTDKDAMMGIAVSARANTLVRFACTVTTVALSRSHCGLPSPMLPRPAPYTAIAVSQSIALLVHETVNLQPPWLRTRPGVMHLRITGDQIEIALRDSVPELP
ncbi:hypothetical protein [Streptomyces galbus]|uniref:Uncharacterized protein n=1 Tax=Streptomyces galbus TaxID=33898 RepID=A0A4U5WVR3_STRGB|nr:hypothetical protein [Streptomyces galbus]TKT06559.1 hypothetical protein E4U92_26955 [Streptomyces galbus]GHD54082.1 hypothetical protein GCM10010335_68180 [Streptomyces galbus]